MKNNEKNLKHYFATSYRKEMLWSLFTILCYNDYQTIKYCYNGIHSENRENVKMRAECRFHLLHTNCNSYKLVNTIISIRNEYSISLLDPTKVIHIWNNILLFKHENCFIFTQTVTGVLCSPLLSHRPEISPGSWWTGLGFAECWPPDSSSAVSMYP